MFEELRSVTLHFHDYGSVLLDLSSMTVWEEEETGEMFSEIPVFTDSNASVIQASFDLLNNVVNSDLASQVHDWLKRKKGKEL